MAIEGLKSYYQINGGLFHAVSEVECERIINAALTIMETTGLEVQHERAVALLDKAGCRKEGKTVIFPRNLVIRCINSAAPELVLYDRFGNVALRAGGSNTYYGLGPTNPFFNDFETGRRREAVRRDVTYSARVADACPNIDFVMGLAQISDCPVPISDVVEMYEMLTNTVKPVIGWGVGVEGLREQVEMCSAIAGSRKDLIDKPFAALFPGCPVTPLIIPHLIYEKLEYCVQSGLPVIWMSGAQLGSVAPVTMAGALASGLAEMLAGVVLSQLIREGCSIACGMVVLTVDMSTTHSAYGSPEHCLGESIVADLFHYLNLPSMQTGGVTDSKLVAEQAAIETSMQIIMNSLSGGHLVHDVGFLDGAMSGALEQIVMSDEIIGFARRITKGMKINRDTLALDVIHEVGPGGEFLTHEHTFEHFREEFWFPTLIDRQLYSSWSKTSLDMRSRIHNKTAGILAEHRAPALPEEVMEQLNYILEQAQTRIQ